MASDLYKDNGKVQAFKNFAYLGRLIDRTCPCEIEINKRILMGKRNKNRTWTLMEFKYKSTQEE